MLTRNISLPVCVCAPALAVTPSTRVQEADAVSALTWLGQEDPIEQFIIEADVVDVEDIGTGVTKPKVADLAPGAPVERISFKPIRPGRYDGYWES